MAIQKSRRRGQDERRARNLYVRLRLVAVLLSCLFVALTVVFILSNRH